MHIFFECKELEEFHAKIKKLIKDGMGKEVAGDEWKKQFLLVNVQITRIRR